MNSGQLHVRVYLSGLRLDNFRFEGETNKDVSG